MLLTEWIGRIAECRTGIQLRMRSWDLVYNVVEVDFKLVMVISVYTTTQLFKLKSAVHLLSWLVKTRVDCNIGTATNTTGEYDIDLSY